MHYRRKFFFRCFSKLCNLIAKHQNVKYFQSIQDGLTMRFKKKYPAELVNSEWKLGKILDIHPEKGELSGVAKVKTKIGGLCVPLNVYTR